MSQPSTWRTLAWEYGRVKAWWLVPATACVVIAPVCLGYLPFMLMNLGFTYADLREGYDPGLLAVLAVQPAAIALASRVHTRRHFVLPLSTVRLAAFQVISGMVTAAVTCGMSIAIINGLLHAECPVLLPCFWTAVACLCVQAIDWQTGPSWTAKFVLGMAVYTFVGQVVDRSLLQYLNEFRSAGATVDLAWFFCSAWIWGPLSVLAVIGVGNGLARARRGDTRLTDWFADLRHTIWTRATRHWQDRERVTAPRTFRTPRAAQYWLEWYAKGRVVVRTVLFFIILWFGFAIPWNMGMHDFDVMYGLLGSMLLLAGPVFGLILGSDTGQFGRRTFGASRPLSDSDLAGCILSNVARVAATSFLAWIAGILLVVLYALIAPVDGPTVSHRTIGPAMLAMQHMDSWFIVLLVVVDLLLVSWTVVALGASVAMGRPSLVACVAAGLPVALLGTMISARFTHWGITSAASISVVATAGVFVRACQLRLILLRTVALCGGASVLLWIGHAAAIAWPQGQSVLNVRPLVLVLIAAASALPVLPIAAAPCAIYWSRHR